MATDLGKVGVVFKGDYSSTTSYERNDVVYSGNSSYVSVVDNNKGNAVTNTSYWKIMVDGSKATAAATAANTAADNANKVAASVQTTIDSLQSEITKLDELSSLQPRYYVAGWVDDNLSATASETHGDVTEIQDLFYPVLIDHTDNTAGERNKPKVLTQNNALRYKDGTFAPAVGITEDQRAECDVALYLDASASSKYCDAGEFDAEAFYTEYGVSQKLYNASGAEVRILRPWETTSTDYSIMVANVKPFYYLGDAIGKSGKRWKGAFLSGTDWDGIDLTPWKVETTAFSPSGVGTINGKTRSFFFDYKIGDANSIGKVGIGSCCQWFYNNGFYPRTTDCQQVNLMNWSRANNSDTTASVPFAEGGFFWYDAFNGVHEAVYGTNYIHDQNTFSSGISANDACSSEDTWKANGGMRYKETSSSTWVYAGWGTDPSGIKYTGTTSCSNASNLANQYAPKERVNEAIIVGSYAVETGVAEGTEFECYGNTYWWKSISSAKGGGLNMRLYKKMTGQISANNSSGTATTFDVEMILRLGVLDGCSHSGDIWKYTGGGAEVIARKTKSGTALTGTPLKMYVQPDQTKWGRETTITTTEKFSLEDSYIYLGDSVTQSYSWTAKRYAFSPWKKTVGGSVSTGMCFYGYTLDYYEWYGATTSNACRVALRFGGVAYDTACARRSANCSYGASDTHVVLGGFAQVLIEL